MGREEGGSRAFRNVDDVTVEEVEVRREGWCEDGSERKVFTDVKGRAGDRRRRYIIRIDVFGGYRGILEGLLGGFGVGGSRRRR